jgi:hypothetical protein
MHRKTCGRILEFPAFPTPFGRMTFRYFRLALVAFICYLRIRWLRRTESCLMTTLSRPGHHLEHVTNLLWGLSLNDEYRQ